MPDPLPSLPERFEVLSKIGQGGMATVYLAEDRVVRSQVALKVLFPHLRSDELVVERFRREIAAVRRVHHESVVAIHDLIESDDLLCLVLEYHPGADLKRHIRRRGALPAPEVMALATQVLAGLAAAHAQGIVHRDIKPHNILIDDQGRAKIADFGLARVDDLIGVTSHTMTLGTPEYIAPELLSSPVVDGRADLYSLGITLYEAVTGKLPFRATSPLALMKMHQEAAVPDPRALVPEMPRSLGVAIQRAMAKDPEERFATADEMRAALSIEAAALAVRAAETGADRCRSCGAEMIPEFPGCVECGDEPLRVVTVGRGGWRVYVRRDRKKFRWYELVSNPQDTLTFQQKHALVQELEQTGGALQLQASKLDRRLAKTPVVVADHVEGESARALVKVLVDSGLPATTTRRSAFRNLLFALKIALGMGRSGGLFSSLFLLYVAILLVIGASSLGGFIPLLLTAVAAAAFVGLGARWARPIARFSGAEGRHLCTDALAERSTAVFGQIKSPRLRSLLRRVLARGLALRRGLGDDRTKRPEMALEVDRLLGSVLDTAGQGARLGGRLAERDVADIWEQMKVLDEQIANAQTSAATEELIAAKLKLRQVLAEVDEDQRELALVYSQLLDVLSRLGVMSSEVEAAEQDSESLTAMSAIMRELSAELEAHRELSS